MNEFSQPSPISAATEKLFSQPVQRTATRENEFSQQVLLAVSRMKDFDAFLEGPCKTAILMNIHVNLVENMVRRAHAAGKKVYFHADLIHGISSDEYGCEFLCQKAGADGIISTKPKVLEAAVKNHRTAVLRLFLIDTQSLEKGIALIGKIRPAYVEVLPGLASSILPELKEKIQTTSPGTQFLAGGLIHSMETIDGCLADGAAAVTISDRKLAERYISRNSK